MPKTTVLFFQDVDGRSPVVAWLEELRRLDVQAYTKCAALIERLMEVGYELRRPTADLLRDGIYELRARKGRVNYRLLYFFHGRNVAIVAHGLTKEDVVPRAEIERALARKRIYERNPDVHTYGRETT
ncbi:MAG: type II toxin-antitoxin system RelE/ParE family toxin [Phycisphaerales bacterium]